LRALERIDPSRALPLLRRGLGDGDPAVRATAFTLLCGAGPQGVSLALRVAPQFSPPEWLPLASICPDSAPVRLTCSPDPDLRLKAITTCCRRGLLPPERLRQELLWTTCGLLPRASLGAQADAWDTLAPADPSAARRAACLRAQAGIRP